MEAEETKVWLTGLNISAAVVRVLIRQGVLDKQDVVAELREMAKGLRHRGTILTEASDDAIKAVENMPGPND